MTSLKERARIAVTMTPENERFSKIANLVEGLIVYVAIMFLVYRLIFPGTTLLGSIVRTALLVYIIVIGPLIHKNSAWDLGIGNARQLKVELFSQDKPGQISVAVVLIAISILVFPLFLVEFDAILRLVPVIGFLNGIIAQNAPWLRIPVAIVEYIVFQVLLVIVLIRKDNLGNAFKAMLKPVAIIVGIVLLISLVTLELFAVEWDPLRFFATWYGYTFWGIAQQVPFLVYFSTRFRKGFPLHRVSDIVNVGLIAFFFAFFHAPQWTLVVLAFLMEIVIARSFLHDETRNLFVAGIMHGLMGTMLIFFTNLYILVDFI